MNRSRNPDPLGYLDEVRRTLLRLNSNVDSRSSDAKSAAYDVVVNLGYCRLYGIDIPPDVRAPLEAALSDDLIIAAACEFARVLQIWRDDAVCLPNRFDEAEPFEDRSLCTGVLHQRAEAWAAFVAIDEAYQSRLDGGIAPNELDLAMDRVLEELRALDDVLLREDQLRLLSLATELPLLDNSRQMLAAPFDDPLPWWLDGTLEAAAERTSRDILAAARGPCAQPKIAKQTLARNENADGLHLPAAGKGASVEDTPFVLAATRAIVAPPGRPYAVDQELALAADDNPEHASIEYLSTNLPEILSHGNSDIWFGFDPSGALSKHTYDAAIGLNYDPPNGPHRIPLFVNLGQLIEPDVDKLLGWFINDVGLSKSAAKQVCSNLNLRT